MKTTTLFAAWKVRQKKHGTHDPVSPGNVKPWDANASNPGTPVANPDGGTAGSPLKPWTAKDNGWKAGTWKNQQGQSPRQGQGQGHGQGQGTQLAWGTGNQGWGGQQRGGNQGKGQGKRISRTAAPYMKYL